uniref:Pyrroline-5-carboxylate reductase n=1 Tax=Anopheles minimus TaxID=112268 RepID=A0A182W2M8_9DIPT
MSQNNDLPLKETIGFIGGGNMAYAIASGLISKGVLKAEQIWVSATALEKLRNRWSPLGVTHCTINNEDIVTEADIIFICVKPQLCIRILPDIDCVAKNTKVNMWGKLFVSIMAGVTLDRLRTLMPSVNKANLVRAMPNTPLQVGVGCTVFCSFSDCLSNNYALHKTVQFMFGALGLAYEVKESQINAVTGLAGCGPAYVYEFIEALADGGVKQGIPRDMALRLAAQTVMGAAKTVLETGKHPAVLKDEVCSPGGATIHGVHALEQGSMRGTVMNAVERAANRADQLS